MIELQWLDRGHGLVVLQFRQTIQRTNQEWDKSSYYWSDWKNVPVVKE